LKTDCSFCSRKWDYYGFAALAVHWEGIDDLKGKARHFLFKNEGVGFQRLLPVR
jgi:hypothetical protein